MTRRVGEIRRKIQKSDELIPAIVEVKGKKEFTSTYNQTAKSSFDTDPKSAMRIGFARCGRSTQFINSPDDQKSQDALATAANSSFLDSLRQIGLVGGLPISTNEHVSWVNSINFAAVWILRKKEKGFSKVLPIIVFIRRGKEKDEVFATANGLNEFVPYQKFLLKLTDDSNLGWLNDWRTGNNWTESRKRGEADVRRFLQNRLSRLAKLGELIVFAKSQNSKNHWAWLMDKNLSDQNLSFDSCQNFENADDWKNLHVVRVRTTTGDEVPEHIAANPETQAHGNSAGIFKLDEKIFYGAAGKPATAQTTQNFTKIEKANKQVWNANLLEIIPCFLQTEDSPAEFAYLTHTLRNAGVNFSGEYQLPLPLHLAELTKEFIPDFASDEEGDV